MVWPLLRHLGWACVAVSRRLQHRTHLDKGYSPTDVLLAGPQPTDVLDVLYHEVLRSDKCVAVHCTYNT